MLKITLNEKNQIRNVLVPESRTIRQVLVDNHVDYSSSIIYLNALPILPKGLDTIVEEHGANLSGGQRQRIAIARAIIRDPRVIILDEATSALDVISEKEIQEALARLIKGRTTFIVAHRLSTVKGADRIAVLSHGRIVEEGNYTELMEKKGAFYHMESMQISMS